MTIIYFELDPDVSINVLQRIYRDMEQMPEIVDYQQRIGFELDLSVEDLNFFIDEYGCYISTFCNMNQ